MTDTNTKLKNRYISKFYATNSLILSNSSRDIYLKKVDSKSYTYNSYAKNDMTDLARIPSYQDLKDLEKEIEKFIIANYRDKDDSHIEQYIKLYNEKCKLLLTRNNNDSVSFERIDENSYFIDERHEEYDSHGLDNLLVNNYIDKFYMTDCLSLSNENTDIYLRKARKNVYTYNWHHKNDLTEPYIVPCEEDIHSLRKEVDDMVKNGYRDNSDNVIKLPTLRTLDFLEEDIARYLIRHYIHSNE